jgi:hypothetical protein
MRRTKGRKSAGLIEHQLTAQVFVERAEMGHLQESMIDRTLLMLRLHNINMLQSMN